MKPALLYHGSCKGISGALTPRPQHGDENGRFADGPQDLVFATDRYNYAALYALKTEHMLSCGNSNGLAFSVLRDYNAWKNALQQAACAVYELPSNSFENTVTKVGNSPKWKSRNAVIPSRVIKQTPESVMELGNQLFFLDKLITKELWQYDGGPADSTFTNRLQAKYESGQLPKDFTPLHLMRELIDTGLAHHLNAEQHIAPMDLPKSPHADIIKEDIDWLKQQLKNQWLAQALTQAMSKSDWSKQPRNQQGYINTTRSREY